MDGRGCPSKVDKYTPKGCILVIDNRAEIHPSAQIDEGVKIGPWSVIGPEVVIGKGTEIGPHVVISGYTTLGQNNRVFQFVSLGDEPLDITYRNEETRLEIGDNNIIREYSSISRGSAKDKGVTSIGDNNYFLVYSHVGHDCVLGNHVTVVSHAALAGHVVVGDYASIGAYSAVHQFCQVGAYSFIARASLVTKDVLPYMMIVGQSASVCGLNSVGLKRNGFTSEDMDAVKRAYRSIFRKGLTVKQALVELYEILPESDKIGLLIDSLKGSSRGIVR